LPVNDGYREFHTVRDDLTYLVTKFDRVLADGNVVSVLQYRLADALTIDVRSIKALGVFDHIVIAFRVDLGVMSGDGRIVDAKEVVWLAANGDVPPESKSSCKTRSSNLRNSSAIARLQNARSANTIVVGEEVPWRYHSMVTIYCARKHKREEYQGTRRRLGFRSTS
jgi:hypothetical protein